MQKGIFGDIEVIRNKDNMAAHETSKQEVPLENQEAPQEAPQEETEPKVEPEPNGWRRTRR